MREQGFDLGLERERERELGFQSWIRERELTFNQLVERKRELGEFRRESLENMS